MNRDFADVRTVMQNMGYALMGSGVAEGENRAVNAAKAAINNPLLADINLHGCQALLINVSAGPDIKMNEFEDVSSVIVNETGTNANIFMGLVIEPDLVGKISVTIIATGLQSTAQIVDFPPALPVSQTKPAPQPKPTPPKPTKPEDDIEDIFRVLNINQPASQEADPDSHEEETRQLSPRTDLPSFLKALD